MSRIGRQPIAIPEGVTVSQAEGKIVVKGPKGELSFALFPELKVNLEGSEIRLQRRVDKASALHGLMRALLMNAVIGVTQGFEKHLELVGTVYRAKKEGEKLSLSLGFSHPVIVTPEIGISLDVEEQKEIIVKGIDKYQVGQMAANIRKLRKPEPYKGKGIRYKDEIVKLKPGKAAKVGAAQSES